MSGWTYGQTQREYEVSKLISRNLKHAKNVDILKIFFLGTKIIFDVGHYSMLKIQIQFKIKLFILNWFLTFNW